MHGQHPGVPVATAGPGRTDQEMAPPPATVAPAIPGPPPYVPPSAAPPAAPSIFETARRLPPYVPPAPPPGPLRRVAGRARVVVNRSTPVVTALCFGLGVGAVLALETLFE